MRPPRLVGLLIICLLLLPAQQSALGASRAVQYSARLNVSSRPELKQRLYAAFTEGTAHPAGILNCAQMLAQRGDIPQSSVSDRELQAERSTLTECLVLQALQRATPARVSYVQNLPWDEHVLPLLPPQLAITVSAESARAANAAARHGQSWPEFDPSATASAKGPEEVVITGQGFREQLVLWGRGDFNGDGTEDLLVQSLDTLTEGTYRNTRLFVLTRRTANGRLSLVRSLL